MRPLTHDDPDAIPRNGTEVPWVEIPELSAADPPAEQPRPVATTPQGRRDRRNLYGTTGQRGT
jgi:hypothetical protein